MQSRRNQLGVIIFLGCVVLITGGCSNGDGTEGVAASSKSHCSSSKSCPIADAGPDQTVLVGTQTTLDGSASSAGTTGLISYQWTLTSRPSGSIVTLAGATTVRPSFTPDVAGDYSIKLVVDNGGLLSKPDSVTISAGIGNLPPIADAGPDFTGHAFENQKGERGLICSAIDFGQPPPRPDIPTIEKKIEVIESDKVKALFGAVLKELEVKSIEVKPIHGRWISCWYRGKRFMYMAPRKNYFVSEILRPDGTWNDRVRIATRHEWDQVVPLQLDKFHQYLDRNA